jgi:hypothetical protein
MPVSPGQCSCVALARLEKRLRLFLSRERSWVLLSVEWATTRILSQWRCNGDLNVVTTTVFRPLSLLVDRLASAIKLSDRR